jgi:hypothetical protein
MKAQFLIGAVAILMTAPAKAQNLDEIAKFAQTICGDIPSGSLTRTSIKGKVQARVGMFAKLIDSSGEADASKTEEIYKGIPFDRLPQNIPTISMCKTLLQPIAASKTEG